MILHLSPSRLAGRISAPPSKSHAQRLLIAAWLAGDIARVSLPSCPNADIAACMHCLHALEAAQPRLHCQDSGAVLRFLTPVAAALHGAHIDGSVQLRARPMQSLLDVLRQNGCTISQDTLPFCISGGLHGGEYAIAGNISSQFISGLLFALPLLEQDSRIRLTTPLVSAGYVDMTLDVLARFGICVSPLPDGFGIAGGQRYQLPQGMLCPEGDWSSAAVWLAINALGGRVTVQGLRSDSLQGDRRMAKLCADLPYTVDISDIPDLLPLLSVLATQKTSATRFTHAGRLRYKESDRLTGSARLICALGGNARVADDDTLLVYPVRLSGGTVDAQGDHRMAMAAAAAACVCPQGVVLHGAQCVDKSYPAFWQHYALLGGKTHVL